MTNIKYTLPLAVLFSLGQGPATDTAKEAYNQFFNGKNRGIERVVQAPTSRLEGLLEGSVAYGEEKNSVEKPVDYEGLAKKAEELINKDNKEAYLKVIKILQPYENNKENMSAKFYNILGIAYGNIRDFVKSEKMYKKSIDLDPNNEENRINLGYLYLRDINTPESRELAKTQFLRALEINPNSKYAKFFLEKIRKGKF